MSNSVAVPLAWNNPEERVVVWPDEADKHKDYSCPECCDVVHLRGGPKVQLHFYHIKPGDCTGEGALHTAAKHALAAMINTHDGAVAFSYRCGRCSKDVIQTLPRGDFTVDTEVRFGTRRLDIGILDPGGTVQAAIEIKDSHAVDSDKAAELASLPWVEVSARNVLAQPRKPLPILKKGENWATLYDNGCPRCNGSPVKRNVTWPGNVECPRYPLRPLESTCKECRFHRGYHPDRRTWGIIATVDCDWSSREDDTSEIVDWTVAHLDAMPHDRWTSKRNQRKINTLKKWLASHTPKLDDE